MATKADFTPQEWELVLEGPPSAGMIVITAQRGGMLRETVSMAKAYVEARQHHGQSGLLDEIVVAKPKLDHTRYGSLAELKEHSITCLICARRCACVTRLSISVASGSSAFVRCSTTTGCRTVPAALTKCGGFAAARALR